jgi:RNA polymerase sigma-70 factor (ECF subfamily)
VNHRGPFGDWVIMATNSQSLPTSCDGLATSRVDYTKLTDNELMTSLKSGESQALSELFLRYRRAVMSVCLRRLQDWGEAEDVTQEVFIDIYKKIDTFDPKKVDAKTWILLRAYHDALNRRQYLKVRKFYDAQKICVEDLQANGSPDISTNWRGLSIEEWRWILKKAMTKLRPPQSTVLEMACFDGLRVPEISKLTGESLDQVAHHYHRGLKKLGDAVHALISRDSDTAKIL